MERWSKELAEKVKEFRKDTEEGLTVKALTSKDYEKPLTDLYQILIKPVEQELAGKKHLVVVPHGMLHYLPFQALRSPEGQYLIESHTVSYLPSASVLKYAREKNRGNHEDLLAVANPKTDLSPLPAAELEAREVSALFNRKQVLLGQGATETKFKSEGPRYDMLLFSTHGEMIESAPLESNLRFTPTPQDDGKLTVSEIFDMEVKLPAVPLQMPLGAGRGGRFHRVEAHGLRINHLCLQARYGSVKVSEKLTVRSKNLEQSGRLACLQTSNQGGELLTGVHLGPSLCKDGPVVRAQIKQKRHRSAARPNRRIGRVALPFARKILNQACSSFFGLELCDPRTSQGSGEKYPQTHKSKDSLFQHRPSFHASRSVYVETD